MLTNKTISKDEALYEKGKTLTKAAYDYWEEYNKLVGSSAIVWLQNEDGNLILFTRGEYREQIMREVDRINLDEKMYEFISPSKKEE